MSLKFFRGLLIFFSIIVNGNFPYCGGTIIGPSTILTAAHCLYDVPHPDNVTVLVAEHDITTSNETNIREYLHNHKNQSSFDF